MTETAHPVELPEPSELAHLVAAQIEQARATAAVVDALRESVIRQTRAQWVRTVATVVLVLALIVVAVDNRIQINRLQRLLCPIVTSSITRPGEIGPTTPHGRDVERSAKDLAAKLGCAILPR